MCLYFYIFGNQNWKKNDLSGNANKRSLITTCRYYVPEKNSDILSPFQNVNLFHPFEGKILISKLWFRSAFWSRDLIIFLFF